MSDCAIQTLDSNNSDHLAAMLSEPAMTSKNKMHSLVCRYNFCAYVSIFYRKRQRKSLTLCRIEPPWNNAVNKKPEERL